MSAGGGRANRYAGCCVYCGAVLEPGAGELNGSRRVGWRLTCPRPRWVGSPVSGWYVGGCVGEAERLNAGVGRGPGADVPAGSPSGELEPERVEVEAGQAAGRVEYRAYSGGRRRAGWRCEDAPCCGCCD